MMMMKVVRVASSKTEILLACEALPGVGHGSITGSCVLAIPITLRHDHDSDCLHTHSRHKLVILLTACESSCLITCYYFKDPTQRVAYVTRASPGKINNIFHSCLLKCAICLFSS